MKDTSGFLFVCLFVITCHTYADDIGRHLVILYVNFSLIGKFIPKQKCFSFSVRKMKYFLMITK